MRSIFVFFSLVGAFCAANFLNAAITEVIVYPQGAQVKEAQTITLKKGENILEWGMLSPQVDVDSLRVELPAGARLIDSGTKAVHTTQEQNIRRAELEKLLEKALQRLQAINDVLILIEKNEAYLEQIQQASTTPVKGEASYAFPAPAQWSEMINFTRTGREKLLDERRDAEQKKVVAQKEISKIQREMNELGNQPVLKTQKLTLTIESLKDQTVTASVAYFDPAAGWHAAYQVWVDPTTKEVQVTYGALVRQSTLNAWEGVDLRLSTARPQTGATPPELAAWWVREMRDQPRPVFADSMMKGSRKSAVMTIGTVQENGLMEDSVAFAQVVARQNLTFAEFKIPGKSVIPADNEEHRLVVAEVPLKGELSYAVVPEVSTEAYLQATVTNNSDFTLLPGQTQLYSDGNFVGRSELKIVLPGESFDLNLGVDPSVKVERKQLAKKTDMTGLMDDLRRITYTYSIELKNLKKSSQVIKLQERLPVSQHEKIKVELLEPKFDAKTLGKVLDKEGILKWEVSLKAGEVQKIILSYYVEYPKNMQVEGL